MGCGFVWVAPAAAERGKRKTISLLIVFIFWSLPSLHYSNHVSFEFIIFIPYWHSFNIFNNSYDGFLSVCKIKFHEWPRSRTSSPSMSFESSSGRRCWILANEFFISLTSTVLKPSFDSIPQFSSCLISMHFFQALALCNFTHLAKNNSMKERLFAFKLFLSWMKLLSNFGCRVDFHEFHLTWRDSIFIINIFPHPLRLWHEASTLCKKFNNPALKFTQFITRLQHNASLGLSSQWIVFLEILTWLDSQSAFYNSKQFFYLNEW